MRFFVPVVLVACALLAPAPAATGAGSSLPLGRYEGQTGDGHVFQFTVERSKKANHPRKITHIYLVYDIAGCRSGPIRQPFFASVYYGKTASRRGKFSRNIPRQGGETNQVQLRLTGRFTSATRASGTFRVGVIGRCPIGPTTTPLTFSVKRI